MQSTKKILIIDDDPRNIFALKATLKAKGFVCISCLDAFEAKAIVNKEKDIGIILIDMMMPGMDGYEAISYLRDSEGYGKIPVIAVTAQAMVGDKEKCLQAGANNYLSKPIDVDLMLTILDQYLC